jgi:hypothetical protein
MSATLLNLQFYSGKKQSRVGHNIGIDCSSFNLTRIVVANCAPRNIFRGVSLRPVDNFFTSLVCLVTIECDPKTKQNTIPSMGMLLNVLSMDFVWSDLHTCSNHIAKQLLEHISCSNPICCCYTISNRILFTALFLFATIW